MKLYKIYLFLLFANCNNCFITTNSNMFSLKTIKTTNYKNINYKNNILALKSKNNLDNDIAEVNSSILIINMGIFANYACGVTDIRSPSLLLLYSFLLYLSITKIILLKYLNKK